MRATKQKKPRPKSWEQKIGESYQEYVARCLLTRRIYKEEIGMYPERVTRKEVPNEHP